MRGCPDYDDDGPYEVMEWAELYEKLYDDDFSQPGRRILNAKPAHSPLCVEDLDDMRRGLDTESRWAISEYEIEEGRLVAKDGRGTRCCGCEGCICCQCGSENCIYRGF